MSQRDRSLLLLLSVWLISLPAEPLQAQVTPDDSLGKEHSVVRAESARQLIEGGASRGSNLFHSFSEFNVRDHGAVYFAPPEGITNILSRITGNSESSILGTLGVEGTANLFLLNPHGIIFGENANLDLRGSFLATTANSYLFDRELEYSATNPNTPPLLAVNIPLGIQFGSNPATIINRSRFVDSHNVMQGLNISEQKTLSLIGGDVVIEGGYLSTSAGKIEIGAVDSYNMIAITPDQGWTFNYQGVTGFRDIIINNGGKIDGGTVGNSQIALTGRDISLGYDLAEISELGYDIEDFFTLEPLPEIVDLVDDFSQITANNTDNATPSQIAIAASDTFSMIRADDLLAKTAGMGDAGAINIEADTVIIYDVGFDAGTQENSSGNGGLVTFDANNLSLQKGDGEVGTAGSGNGGTINLNIAEDLKIQFGGFGADTFATGNGGTINLSRRK